MVRTVERHDGTWLCRDDAARERLLDMDERLRGPRTLAFAALGAGLIAAGPSIGWWPIALLLVAGVGFAVADALRPRLRRPELGVAGSWAFAQCVIAVAVVGTGGPDSPAVLWLAVPLVTLPARFDARGVVAGGVFTALLVVLTTLVVVPAHTVTGVEDTVFPLAALAAIALLSSALMQSDVDHRTDALIDGLTGMLNRRAVDERLAELEAQSRVSGEPVALVLGDVDHFKVINDSHGHARGDAVLVDVAYRLRKGLRAFDLAYRIGGEEFLVVLPGASAADATAIAEELRAAVAAWPAAGLAVTMSFGVAGTAGGELDAGALVEAADRALYEAKATGRDRVRIAGTDGRRPAVLPVVDPAVS